MARKETIRVDRIRDRMNVRRINAIDGGEAAPLSCGAYDQPVAGTHRPRPDQPLETPATVITSLEGAEAGDAVPPCGGNAHVESRELVLLAHKRRTVVAPQLTNEVSRVGVPLYSGGRQVGKATSTGWSTLLKKFIAIATVDRGLFERDFWSIEMAGERPEISSTSGFCIWRRN